VPLTQPFRRPALMPCERVGDVWLPPTSLRAHRGSRACFGTAALESFEGLKSDAPLIDGAQPTPFPTDHPEKIPSLRKSLDAGVKEYRDT